jgi:hypothetical protein
MNMKFNLYKEKRKRQFFIRETFVFSFLHVQFEFEVHIF